MRKPYTRSWPLRSLGLVGALALGGCTITSRTPTVDFVAGYRADVVATVPATIERYPHTRYGDSEAYLVDGRWYYRAPEGRWLVFREEPRELQRYRTEITLRPPAPSVTVYIYGTPAERVRTVPSRIEEYPRVPYGASYAYLVDGTWYYRSPEQGWVRFQEEPRELRRYRVEQPPPRQPTYGYPPPAPR